MSFVSTTAIQPSQGRATDLFRRVDDAQCLRRRSVCGRVAVYVL